MLAVDDLVSPSAADYMRFESEFPDLADAYCIALIPPLRRMKSYAGSVEARRQPPAVSKVHTARRIKQVNDTKDFSR